MQKSKPTKPYLANFIYDGPNGSAEGWAKFDMERPPVHSYAKAVPVLQKFIKRHPRMKDWKIISIKYLYLLA